MVPRFFGQYLLSKGLISAEKLLKAIEYQQSFNKKFEDIAIEKTFLTQDKVNNIVRERKSLFTLQNIPELAMEMGFLSRKQFDEIIKIQNDNYKSLEDAISELKILPAATVKNQLSVFRTVQKKYKYQKISLPFEYKFNYIIINYISLAIELLYGKIGVEAKLGESRTDIEVINNPFITVMISFIGDLHASFYITMNEKVATFFASKSLGAKNLPEDLIKDEIGEFLNEICGHFIAILERKKIMCNISIPQKIKDPVIELPKNKKIIYTPVDILQKGFGDDETIKLFVSIPEGFVRAKEKRVLIVDDSRSLAFRLKLIIEDISGVEVIGHARSGEEALTMFKEYKPDLITMDIIMPGIDGIETIKQIKMIDPNIPIIVISALGESKVKVFEAIKSGALNFIAKPFIDDNVKLVVKSYL